MTRKHDPVETSVAVAERKFRVALNATTPLLHKELVVEAEDEAEAWQRFCDINGISGSACPREITRIED